MAKKAKQRAVGIIGRKVIRMYFEQNGLCGYCGTDKMFLRHTVPKKFYQGNRHLVATFDHIVAKAKGGTYKYTNGVCACARCNTIKADMSVEEFFEKYDELHQRLVERPQRIAAQRQKNLKKNGYIVAWFAQQIGETVEDIFLEYVYNIIY